MFLQFSDGLVFCKTISNQEASSLIGAHIDPFVLSFGIFGERLNGVPGHDAQLTELYKVCFSDYLLESANHFDCFEYIWIFCEWLKP